MLQIEMPKAGDGHANTRRCTRTDGQTHWTHTRAREMRGDAFNVSEGNRKRGAGKVFAQVTRYEGEGEGKGGEVESTL